MSRKIIGVTVGTPISPARIEHKIKPVKTVNGNPPDENGNVDVEGSFELTEEQIAMLKGVGVASVKQTTTSTESGGSNVVTVTLTNGNTYTFTVKNGAKGDPGKDGEDYVLTDADKQEIASLVLNQLPRAEEAWF